jgi:hypothetical protein
MGKKFLVLIMLMFSLTFVFAVPKDLGDPITSEEDLTSGSSNISAVYPLVIENDVIEFDDLLLTATNSTGLNFNPTLDSNIDFIINAYDGLKAFFIDSSINTMITNVSQVVHNLQAGGQSDNNILWSIYNSDDYLKTTISSRGVQEWYLSNSGSEIGKIFFSISNSLPGIGWISANNTGRGQITQYSSDGGIGFGTTTGASNPGNMFIMHANGSLDIISGDLDLLNGNIKITKDNKKVSWGTSDDSSIYYDGSDLFINPREIGSGDLHVRGSGARLSFSQTSGGGGSGVMYKDNSGSERYALRFDSNIVHLTNRASNGEVKIQASTSAGGSSGEQTQIHVTDTDVTIYDEVIIDALSSTYTGGSAYLCVYDNGSLFAQEASCP